MLLFALLLACSGPRGLCGEGTSKIDGTCVVDDARSCGEGTVASGGACLPEGVPMVCGPGTIEDNGVCLADPDGYDGAISLFFPFPAGHEAQITQANQSGFSHNGTQAWAVDFRADVGTSIAAVRGGVVMDTREDSDTGCDEASCADDANYVRIDHGDGTFGVYLHLEFQGVEVEPGDVVAPGEIIGRTGNTGWSTGPHLHLHVLGTNGFSVPLHFLEFEGSFGDGTPYPGASAVSQNELGAVPAGRPSNCLAADFLYRGVELLDAVPCSEAEIGLEYAFDARLPPGNDLAVHRYSTVREAWLTECFPASNGIAAATVRFDGNDFEGTSYLQFSASPAGQDCASYWSWLTSPLIYLR